MKTLKKSFYQLMFEVSDFIMWVGVNDQSHWKFWWKQSERFRELRDAV